LANGVKLDNKVLVQPVSKKTTASSIASGFAVTVSLALTIFGTSLSTRSQNVSGYLGAIPRY
jgi:hypothetical protein